VAADLTVEGFPGVYVLGDFANIHSADDDTLPQLGSVAQQSCVWTAQNILLKSPESLEPRFTITTRELWR